MTADEVAGVTIFAALSAAERERLAPAAADISLLSGEYAAHQGDERAPSGCSKDASSANRGMLPIRVI